MAKRTGRKRTATKKPAKTTQPVGVDGGNRMITGHARRCPDCGTINVIGKTVDPVSGAIWCHCQVCGRAFLWKRCPRVGAR